MFCGPVAQLGERHIRIVEVASSILARSKYSGLRVLRQTTRRICPQSVVWTDPPTLCGGNSPQVHHLLKIAIQTLMKQSKALYVGLGQINPTVGDFAGNTDKICSYIESAETQGLDLLIFPELSISGYPVWDLANKASFIQKNQESLRTIIAVTKGKHVAVTVGFIDHPQRGETKSHNALAVIRNGKVIHKQYKTLLPTYDVFLEQIFFASGKTHKVLLLGNHRIGASICEDIWDDSYSIKPAKILARKGAKILINISASPYHKDVVAARGRVILRKAKEYGLWIIYVNQVGGQDDLVFDGRSFICNPKGQIQFQAEPFREGLYKTRLDFQKNRSIQPAGKVINTVREMYQALVLGLSDYVRKNRFRRVVVGLSGGIDSALVATLARDALGPQSVIGVAMPGPFSSSHSIRDARHLAECLGIEFRMKPIRSHYSNFIKEAIQEKQKRRMKPVERTKITLAMENLQARLRGLELMYLSNDEGALLLTTGNKSELAMGYCTLYGDMCGGLSVLGDVYKTDVYRIAEFRNSISKVIPDSSLKKAPSAELRPHQKDQDSLPSYSILDQVLFLYIEKNKSFQEIVKTLGQKGVSIHTIKRVLRAVDHNEYKRRQLPPALRVTEKAWFGRRMPITNRFEE